MPNVLSQYQRQFYERARDQQAKELAALTDLRLSKRLTAAAHKEAMLDSMKQYYIQLALVAKGGRSLTSRDKRDVGRFLVTQRPYLEKFSTDIDHFLSKEIQSIQGALSRSSSYANAWGVFTRFSIPAALADALPALPGIDCLGGMLCGCWLEWSTFDHAVEVYWHVNGVKEHCALCAQFEVEWSPLSIPIEELDSELFDEESDFFYE